MIESEKKVGGRCYLDETIEVGDRHGEVSVVGVIVAVTVSEVA